jgi:hypothetical protein
VTGKLVSATFTQAMNPATINSNPAGTPPGLYKWSTAVTISADVTLTGGANDIWIFQIAGDLAVAAGVSADPDAPSGDAEPEPANLTYRFEAIAEPIDPMER